ncbi:MAG TPA: hypothetical protein VNB30_04840 [Rhizomicrobium sp.]|jgi:hypothetical protein|nr:hypothetical protein [Rhizomicrobium sp.]
MTETNEKSNPGSRNKKATVAEAFSPPVPDDLRRDAMRHLLDHLESGSSLILRCEDLTSQPGDRVGPINAAARVLLANAKVADALARISQVEQRKRSVVLHLQDDRPTREELIREIEEEKRQSGEDPIARLERRLDQIREREEAAKKLMAQPLPARLLPKDEPVTEPPDDANSADDDDADDDS